MNKLGINCLIVLLALGCMNFALAEEPASQAKSKQVDSQLDRLDLDTTSVKGNSELPKVLYIVPWKQAGIGDLLGKPVNSLLDEVLAPLDRDVFRRQVRYFDQLYATSEPVAEKE